MSNQEITQLRNELNNYKHEIESYKEINTILNNQVRHAESFNLSFMKDIKQLGKLLDEEREKNAQQENEIKKLIAEKENLEAKNKELENKLKHIKDSEKTKKHKQNENDDD